MGMTEIDLLLTGGIVVTMDDDRRILDPGAVAVQGNSIVAVGDPAQMNEMRAARTVDCTGKAVLPGFIDCHSHLFQSLAKGLGDGLAMWPWLRDFMWPYGQEITRAEARSAALVGALQAVASGTTAVLDHHNAPNDLESTLAQADAIEEVGMRGVVARTIRGPRPDLGSRVGLPESLTRSIEEELEITRGALEARSAGHRVVVWPAPANPTHVDPRMLAQGVELAREFETGWHTHCSEDRSEPDMFRDTYGARPVQWLAREGLLDLHATLAHAIWLDDSEIEILGRAETGVSHNPVSNAYIGCGLIRLRDLRSAGAVVGLGTDGPAVTGQNIIQCMKYAVLLQRIHALDPTVAAAEEALELATREGARYLGIDAGYLAPGRLADMAVVNLESRHLVPVHNVVSTLVYLADGRDIEMTIVDGRIVYEDGESTMVDEKEVLAEAKSRAHELAGRLPPEVSPRARG
jgi:5-methylthioadenosine/S-adenosylhomocysteine deaminase